MGGTGRSPHTESEAIASNAQGGGWDSNPRPPGPQPGALPTELPPPRIADGIREPASPALRDRAVPDRQALVDGGPHADEERLGRCLAADIQLLAVHAHAKV